MTAGPPHQQFTDAVERSRAAEHGPLPAHRRPLILHITGDYPDPVREPTTEAVKRLIDGLETFDHVIFSLKRLADPRRAYLVPCPASPNQSLYAMGHFGLPFGVGLHRAFVSVADRINQELISKGLQPALVHSHRLTFDGIAGSIIARQRSIPHFLSVRGEVERKILTYKPTYHGLVRRIVAEADQVFYISAWFRPRLERLAADAATKGMVLPNIVNNVRATISPVPAERRFVAAANLDIYRKKGLDRLIRAFANAGTRIGGYHLDIYGGGSETARNHLMNIAKTSGVGDRVHLLGKVANADLLAALPRYTALALPARNETFGMVYTESLFAGVPILYGRNTGVDGFLDGLDVGVAVEPTDEAAISAGLIRLADNATHFRQSIAASASELHRRFDPVQILSAYETAARRAIAANAARHD